MSQPLQWKLFIKKRASATQGVPPGKDELKWVANTTTLIYGEQDALLVDTFLSDAQTADLADWIATTGRRFVRDLYHSRASRPFLRVEAFARSLSFGSRACTAAGGRDHAESPHSRFRCKLEATISRTDTGSSCRCRSAR